MDHDEDKPESNSPPFFTSVDGSNQRSEFDFIEEIRRKAANRLSPSALRHGIGDDAAVISQSSDRDLLITSDLLVERIDFIRDATEPELLGHKALAVSLSDIAAMGARPRWALCSLGLPEDVWNDGFPDRFYNGFFSLADQYDVKLIGGDVSRTPERIVIDSIVLGECAAKAAITRAGAQPGDRIFVTGSLGGAASGLRLIERGARLNRSSGDAEHHLINDLLVRHLRPDPRVGWGLVLGQEKLATSMIDLSDGLSSDLHHLCKASGVGALVNTNHIPVDPQVVEICGRRALDPLMLALHGGEDFELLFTVRPADVKKLPRRVDGIPVTEIGEIRAAADGVCLAEGTRVWELTPEGWQHF